MGSYTPNQKLYLVEPDEFVDVEHNINFNWRKLDDSVKHLVGWAPTDAEFITGTEDVSNGRKFLKQRSNSTWYALNGQVDQDTVAFVNTWTLLTPSNLASGWEFYTQSSKTMYTVDADGDVSLRGHLRLIGGAEIIPKTTYHILTLPVAARPANTRYAFQHMGNSDSGTYSVNRFLIGSDGVVQIVRYGGTQSSAGERYVCLSPMSYPKNVGA